MSLNIEKEVDVSFPFDYEALAEEVVSFAIEKEDFPYEAEVNLNPDTGEIMLGDIVISVDRVKEQAESYGHSEKREFAFLILHSMLHLFGYDHMTPEEAACMEGKQEAILNEMNILR